MLATSLWKHFLYWLNDWYLGVVLVLVIFDFADV